MEKNKIFISHRHSDTQSDCHRLKSDLQKIFGKDQVFLDIENLEPGIKFAEAIEKTLAQSKVVLVVIGPDWLHVTNDKGGKRLFDEKDWVRREIAASLNDANTRVIPVLVKGSNIPEEEDLPADLKPLTQLQVAEITTKRWDYDLGELIKVLERLVPKRPDRSTQNTAQRQYIPNPPKPKSWLAKNYVWVLGATVVFFILIGIMSSREDVIETYDNDTKNAFQEPIQEKTESENNPNNANGTLSQSGDPRNTNPSGTEIYNSLTFEDKIPDFSGKWWLYENGIRSGYFQISQSGSEFSFSYYLFDLPVGNGKGYYENNGIVTETFIMNDASGNYGFSFLTEDEGKTWIGQTYADQITSPSYLVKN